MKLGKWKRSCLPQTHFSMNTDTHKTEERPLNNDLHRMTYDEHLMIKTQD